VSSLRRLQEVASGVYVATSSKYTTTTTVIVAESNALLVDPCWTPSELSDLADDMAALELAVATGFSTHAHYDHMLWHPRFGTAPRWTSPQAVDDARVYHDELLAQLGDDWPAELADVLDGIAALDSQTVPEPFGAGGRDESIRLLTHNGHAPGHTGVWLEERGVFVAGDMLSDIELPLPFSPDDLPAYLDALDVLAPAVIASSVLIPGHGHVTADPLGRLDADRRYLDDVINGRPAEDPRRANEGMDDAHQQIVRLAREMR
jgi:glyoxylase-like metal-dependent hydrolase (beta-lactamase superfamily II)